MKSLQFIQTATKVLKILSIVAAVFSFIGAGFSVLGGAVLFAMPDLLGPETMDMLMDMPEMSDFNTYDMAITCFAGALIAAAQGVLLMFAHAYFKRAEEDGTPFTHDGAKQLLTLGILSICIPIGSFLAAALFSALFGAEINLNNNVEISIGVAMLIVSRVYEYGATLADKVKQLENEQINSNTL